jgi:hypothetical protein
MTTKFSAWFARHPVQPGRTDAQRWEAFKLYARDRVQVFALRQRRAQRLRRAAQAQSAAQAAREWALRPGDAAAADAWAEAQQRLQTAQEAEAARAATFAGVLWEDWGETSTAWFHRLAEQRRADSTIASLEVPSPLPGGAPHVVSLADEAGRAAASDCFADFYDGSRPSGLFCPRATDPAAQEEVLSSLDARLSPQASSACEGALGAAGIGADELLAALQACARGKVPGADGLTYEFYRAFWPVVGAPLAAVFSAAFAQEGGRLFFFFHSKHLHKGKWPTRGGYEGKLPRGQEQSYSAKAPHRTIGQATRARQTKSGAMQKKTKQSAASTTDNTQQAGIRSKKGTGGPPHASPKAPPGQRREAEWCSGRWVGQARARKP